jgi:hypothetical protein
VAISLNVLLHIVDPPLHLSVYALGPIFNGPWPA